MKNIQIKIEDSEYNELLKRAELEVRTVPNLVLMALRFYLRGENPLSDFGEKSSLINNPEELDLSKAKAIESLKNDPKLKLVKPTSTKFTRNFLNQETGLAEYQTLLQCQKCKESNYYTRIQVEENHGFKCNICNNWNIWDL